MKIRNHAIHLCKVFDRKEQDKVLRDIKRVIKQKNLEFDGFIVTGLSGITLGSILARSLKKELAIVRKEGEERHSTYDIENFQLNRRYLFLDDLIASGETYKHVRDSLSNANETKWLYEGAGKDSKIIGTILFYPRDSYEVKFFSNQTIGKMLKWRY